MKNEKMILGNFHSPDTSFGFLRIPETPRGQKQPNRTRLKKKKKGGGKKKEEEGIAV